MRLPRLSPAALMRSICSLRRASSHGIGGPPESTHSTPSCRMRRSGSTGSLCALPPSPMASAIFGVSFPSNLGAGIVAASPGDAANAATPAVCIRLLREILPFMNVTHEILYSVFKRREAIAITMPRGHSRLASDIIPPMQKSTALFVLSVSIGLSHAAPRPLQLADYYRVE